MSISKTVWLVLGRNDRNIVEFMVGNVAPIPIRYENFIFYNRMKSSFFVLKARMD